MLWATSPGLPSLLLVLSPGPDLPHTSSFVVGVTGRKALLCYWDLSFSLPCQDCRVQAPLPSFCTHPSGRMPFWKEPLGLSDSVHFCWMFVHWRQFLLCDQHGLNRAADLRHTSVLLSWQDRTPDGFHQHILITLVLYMVLLD